VKLGSVSGLIVVPEGEEPDAYRVQRAAELGLHVLGVGFRDNWQDRAHLERVSDLAGELNVELRLGGGGNFYLEGADGEAEVARVAERLVTIARSTSIRFSSLAAGPMLETHRWMPGKPLAERLALLAHNLGRLADAVVADDVVLGLENHCDYRGHEIVAIIEQANRPNLRVQIDTGNAFAVFEEPVDCARALAPYVVSCHLKDVHVTPFAPAPCRGARAVSVPLGEGHVDNVACCQLLQDHAPDPAGIGLMIEPFYLPEGADPTAFLATSVAWARRHLAPFLTD
jgi:sugar phosphate isomerase/epimerase